MSSINSKAMFSPQTLRLRPALDVGAFQGKYPSRTAAAAGNLVNFTPVN
jgi:hypothetical protein